MNFEDLPLRHPRDVLVQDASRAIRDAINGMNYQFSDFVAAFLNCGPLETSTSKAIRNVFDTMATDRGLTPGEKVMIIGSLLQSTGGQIIQAETRSAR